MHDEAVDRVVGAPVHLASLATAAVLLVTVLCGCASGHPSPSQTDREWLDNTAGVIAQLQSDLALESPDGDTLRSARAALRKGLYTSLVAYTDFGGCRHMVSAAGDAPARFASVHRSLEEACAVLERAAAFFTVAAKHDDPRALVRAGRIAAGASPLLVSARTALQAATRR
jgi:hypothetical protein